MDIVSLLLLKKNWYGHCVVAIVTYCTVVPYYIPAPLYSKASVFHNIEKFFINLEFGRFLIRTIIFVLTFPYTPLFQYSLTPFFHRTH